MRLRVGNACWHAFHVMDTTITRELGYFDQEGLDVEVVHAKINPRGLLSGRGTDNPYEEVGSVLPDIIKYNIDVVTDVHLRTPFIERLKGNDELRIIGAWKNQLQGCLMAAPGIKSIKDLKGKRIGDWIFGGEYTMWYRRELRKAGLDPDKDVEWVVGYWYGSMREAWKTLRAGKTDAAIAENAYVPILLEEGFNKLHSFVEAHKPHGRPERVTVARKSFIERNPELIKRYWKAAIRGYHYIRIAPEHFPFCRYCETKLRVNNPDERENMRDLRPLEIYEGSHFALDGQPSLEGIRLLVEEYQDGGIVPSSVTFGDIKEVVNLDLVKEAWEELLLRDEVKANLERLAPVVERLGY